MRAKLFFGVVFLACAVMGVAGQVDRRLDVKIKAEQARAVLAILDKRAAGKRVTEADLREVFATEGYRRLKEREASLGRAFEDDAFRDFLSSNELIGRREELRRTLRSWETLDARAAAQRSLAYLPEQAVIRASIYPVIKPRDNSFVFDLKNDPAIFLYLDPAITPEQFENTLAHELHHVGFGTACPAPETTADLEKMPEGKRIAIGWLSAFGEGLAMLAAAGGPEVHPHLQSKAEDRTRWDRDVANFDRDLRLIEAFLGEILDGKLDETAARQRGLEFFGVQGPWYTVGWRMSATIEKELGRKRLIEAFCDTRSLIGTYNEAALKHNSRTGDDLASWSEKVAELAN